eukprot:4486923-Prymnesium_polylepis.1
MIRELRIHNSAKPYCKNGRVSRVTAPAARCFGSLGILWGFVANGPWHAAASSRLGAGVRA